MSSLKDEQVCVPITEMQEDTIRSHKLSDIFVISHAAKEGSGVEGSHLKPERQLW